MLTVVDNWILPTHHTDCIWYQCENAHDGDPETRARHRLGPGQTSGWLIVGSPPVLSHKLKIYADTWHEADNVRVDILRGAEWVTVYDGAIWQEWKEITYPRDMVSAMRYRVRRPPWGLWGPVGNWVHSIYFGVGDEVQLARIEVSPSEVTLDISEAQQFTAHGYDADDNEIAITPAWTVTDTDAGSIDVATGLFTAGTSAGSYPDVVVVTADSFTDTASVTIRPGLPSDICAVFEAIGVFFDDLSADIREVWVVGEYLAAPFESLARLFYHASRLCCEVIAALQDSLAALAAGITAESLLALIQEHWPTLYYLITDPIGWFLVQLTLAFDLEPWHTQSLEFLAKWILQEYFPTLYAIWLDPPGWFATLFEEHFPVLYYLVTDPRGQVLYLIGQAFDLTPYEAQSAEFIVKTLFERWFPELYLFVHDPGRWVTDHGQPLIDAIRDALGDVVEVTWDWLLARYEETFDTFKDRLYSLAEHTLRFFWEGEW